MLTSFPVQLCPRPTLHSLCLPGLSTNLCICMKPGCRVACPVPRSVPGGASVTTLHVTGPQLWAGHTVVLPYSFQAQKPTSLSCDLEPFGVWNSFLGAS